VAIFVLGLALNKWDKSNVFTIVAALAVLPAAKMLVSYIVIAPFHSVPPETYELLVASTAKEDVVYTDVVCTSADKIMNLAILVIAGNQVIGLMGKKKENRLYLQAYLRNNFKTRYYDAKIHIYEEEAQFVRTMKALVRTPVDIKLRVEWEAYLKSLMV
jgi:hypothetical protein